MVTKETVMLLKYKCNLLNKNSYWLWNNLRERKKSTRISKFQITKKESAWSLKRKRLNLSNSQKWKRRCRSCPALIKEMASKDSKLLPLVKNTWMPDRSIN